jgi:hypothetical protein
MKHAQKPMDYLLLFLKLILCDLGLLLQRQWNLLIVCDLQKLILWLSLNDLDSPYLSLLRTMRMRHGQRHSHFLFQTDSVLAIYSDLGLLYQKEILSLFLSLSGLVFHFLNVMNCLSRILIESVLQRWMVNDSELGKQFL